MTMTTIRRGVVTTCGRTGCDHEIIINGDGSIVRRTHPTEGGVYFCSEACASLWATTAHITGVVVHLSGYN